MPRSAASGSSPFDTAARQQLQGHDDLLRWTISQGGLAAPLLELVEDLDLDEEFRKSAGDISDEIERAIRKHNLPPQLASVWRQVPELSFGRSENMMMFDICPGVAQSSPHGDKPDTIEYRPVGVCDATVQIYLRFNPRFSLVEMEARKLHALKGEPSFQITSPQDALTLTCEEYVLQVVVNCYPEPAPLSMAVNDLALLKDSYAEGCRQKNTRGNILFVVEDATLFNFLRKSCNVTLRQEGRIADHDLKSLGEWMKYSVYDDSAVSATRCTIELPPPTSRRGKAGRQKAAGGPSE